MGNLKGKRCLDVACNAGYWCFELARHGAESVFGIDAESAYIRQAEFVRACIRDESAAVDITRFKNMNVVDLNKEDGLYDLITAMGIVYHLTDPIGFFHRMYELCKGCLFVDTAVSTIKVAEPVFAIGSNDTCCAKGEFALVPTEAALIASLNHVGFTNIMKLYSPLLSEPNAFTEGRRIMLIAMK